jgi:metal-sulfur cluster biosynthetic enzyme
MENEAEEVVTEAQAPRPLLSTEEMQALEHRIIEKLKTVIDPETGVDVIRMQLVLNMRVDPTGKVHYIFRPSSPICPLAVHLTMALKWAVASVEGVTSQEIQVADYIQADALTQMINAWEPEKANAGQRE